MPVQVQCTHCRSTYAVSSSALGKQAKCKKCGGQFTITANTVPVNVVTPAAALPPKVGGTAARSSASTAANSSKAQSTHASAPAAPPKTQNAQESAAKPRGRLTEQELLAAFRGEFPRARPRISYRIGILLVALMMVVLPLIYLAFIALVGYGVYYHAVNHTGILNATRGRAQIFLFTAYAAPLVAGPIAVFFMFKPLLARPAQIERSRSLRRESEPLLFAFIDRICQEVGAPRPKRIDVDCNVNASASFRRGILSMFGRDLVLTIGLPLAAGLTVREFGGVMAHEFGHFAQGLAMRLSYLIRSIVHWFVRVVYQRDQWDEWLEQTTNDLDIRVGWIFLVAQLFVLIGRGILWVLLHIGLTISGFMLRQMEFDADRYEARLAGSDSFAKTVRKLHLLNAAFEFAQVQLSASLDERKLVDNLPGLVMHHARSAPPDAAQHINKRIAESRTGWFDSHPCDRERIAAAGKLASPGIFHLERPAADLFTNFNAQAAAATWDLYLGIFGPKLPRTALQSVQEFVAARHG